MNSLVKEFLACKNIAIVGASRTGKKFGNSIATDLKQHGYNILLVHPEADQIDGIKCHPNFDSIKGQADGVIICVPPKKAAQVVQEAAASGIKKVWLQQGADSPESVNAARQAGIEPVAGKCVFMYLEPVTSVHGFHRFFVKLFGKL